jgi:hypothetical protein
MNPEVNPRLQHRAMVAHSGFSQNRILAPTKYRRFTDVIPNS